MSVHSLARSHVIRVCYQISNYKWHLFIYFYYDKYNQTNTTHDKVGVCVCVCVCVFVCVCLCVHVKVYREHPQNTFNSF